MKNRFMLSNYKTALVRAGALLAGVVFLFWYTMNLWAECKLPFIETSLSAAAHRPITLKSARYHIFKGFLLDGLEVRQNKADALPVRIGRVRVEPSFQLWPEPGIGIRKIAFEDADIAFRVRPEDPLSLSLLLDNLAPEVRDIGALKILMRLSSVEVSNGKFLLISSDGQKGVARELNGINFSIRWKKSGTKFTDITFKSGAVEMSGQGESEPVQGSGHYRFLLSSKNIPLEYLKGLLFGAAPDAGFVQFIFTLDGDAKHFEPAMQAVLHNCSLHEPTKTASLTNMDGLIRLSKNGLEFKRLWLDVNRIPLFLDGKCQITESPRLAFKLSTNPAPGPAGRSVKASLKAALVLSREGWGGNLRLTGEKDKWTLAFRGLLRQEGVLWSCRDLQLRHQDRASKGAPEVYSFRRLVAEASSDQKYARVKILEGLWHEAPMRANLWLRTADLAWGVSVLVEDADASKFLAYTRNKYPVSGRLSTDLSWKGAGGDVRFLMHFKIAEGMIGPSPQLAYWAKQTGIEALNAVRFHSFSGEAAYEKGFWALKYFNLAGETLSMNASLRVGAERVWGAFSAKFPSASIQESSELKWLLRFVRAGDWVDFDFKVAGHPASPRVEWQGGEFKKKVESRLAPWMKYELTKQIEKRLAERVADPL